MQGLYTPRAVLGTAFLFVFTTFSAFGQTTLVTDRASLGGTDFIDWASEDPGNAGAAYFADPIYSENATLPVTVSQDVSGANPPVVIVVPTYFVGNFVPGEYVYYTNTLSDELNPLTFSNFGGEGVCAFGLQVQPFNLDVTFDMTIQAFDAGHNPMGSPQEVTGIESTAGGGGIFLNPFIGLTSAAPMHYISVAVSAINGTDPRGYANYKGLFAVNQADFSPCPDLPALSKTLTDGNDFDTNDEPDLVVEVGQSLPATYSFDLSYTEDDSVLILDTVPAEWDAVVGETNDLNCEASSANGKDNGKSATKVACQSDGPGVTSFDAISRCHKNGDCKPSACGALYLNNGARAYGLDENGELLTDENGQLLPPLYTSNALCLAAVKDLNGGGLDYTGGGDEDGDHLSDYEEACDLGLDPCNDDTDGDGVTDDLDHCPLEGPPGVDQTQDGNGCNLDVVP